MLEAKRTLVKSAPELWAEVSDPGALARHLASFGSIRITRTEPDSLVVWEGERASGTVRLTPSGFGTRVTLQAVVASHDPAPEPEPESEPEPEPRRSFWSRLFGRGPEPPPPVVAPPPAAPSVPVMADAAAMAVLEDTLEALGKAHHRPFSRI